MCGIAGLLRTGNTPIREWQLRMLANSLEYRGNDATGFALMDREGHISTLKHHSPAWKFTSDKEYIEWIEKCLTKRADDIVIALVHTRKSTKGSPYLNDNNHPIMADAGCIIHNGHISNDDDLFKDGAYGKRSCETDSDAIRAILDTYGVIDKGLIEVMGDLQGVAAIAAIHPASPGKLLLLRDSAPIMIGATREMIAFASDKRAIHRALKPWVKMHNMIMQVHAPDIAFVPMANRSGWILGAEGLEWHGEFKCNNYGFHRVPQYSRSTDYLTRQKRLKQEANKPIVTEVENAALEDIAEDEDSAAPFLPKYILCSNTSCNKHVKIPEDLRTKLRLTELKCPVCHTVCSKSLLQRTN